MAKKKDPLEGASEQGTTLADFVLEQKITAFVEAYQPCDEKVASKWFDETKLRTFFKAYPCTLGDPLTIYLNRLEDKGFKMKVGAMEEPVIYVTERDIAPMGLLDV